MFGGAKRNSAWEEGGSRRGTRTRWCLSNTAGGEIGVADRGGVETAGPCSS